MLLQVRFPLLFGEQGINDLLRSIRPTTAKKWQNIYLIVCGLLMLLSDACKKPDTGAIISDGKYAIGTIDNFNKVVHSHGGPSKSSVHYYFFVFNTKHENGYLSNYYRIPDSGPTARDNYIVIYDSVDVDKNLMLFDYPITDTAQYNSYVLQFVQNPPQI